MCTKVHKERHVHLMYTYVLYLLHFSNVELSMVVTAMMVVLQCTQQAQDERNMCQVYMYVYNYLCENLTRENFIRCVRFTYMYMCYQY